HLARVVFVDDRPGAAPVAYPDTLVGTDSHTTMINGLGVLGWGVGGIEAEAALLGEPIAILLPDVVGFRLHGWLPEGATASDPVPIPGQGAAERGGADATAGPGAAPPGQAGVRRRPGPSARPGPPATPRARGPPPGDGVGPRGGRGRRQCFGARPPGGPCRPR